jgi:hypothetical protein
MADVAGHHEVDPRRAEDGLALLRHNHQTLIFGFFRYSSIHAAGRV